jgi:integrase
MQEANKKPIAETISIEEIFNLGNSVEDDMVKALFFVCYLTGARIGEAIGITRRDIRVSTTKNELLIDLKTEKRKDHPIRTIPILIMDNVSHTDFNYFETEMVTHILKYTENLSPEALVFPISRQRGFNLLVRYFNVTVRYRLKDNTATEVMPKKINPHYLRHCRLTHLRQEYGYDMLSLMRFAGWKDTQMCNIYLHLGYKDLTKEMLKP